ncbi:hypothetical protein DBR43_09750 [Pedobacter sp. KBW06]|uniref:RteC domain-containing protein n=1 Tax=Pedobacter sp. KBW06 TaxID=2153359 RepID=UPI000F5B2E4E|nr:RteC domain-containing protein [Pedobacter sp. KBW06]RQO75611.1 hypothetical protein DBR43_09750 [Pedobacter sp. KBW06]
MRKTTLKQAFRELRGRLKVITGLDQLSPVEKFNESMCLINDFLTEVRQHISAVAFKDKFEEIYFFKFEKPEFYALKIFQVAQFTMTQQMPVGTREMLREFYLEELAFISRFFKQHVFHYEYFRAGFTDLDEIFFLRGTTPQTLLLPVIPELDSEFSTCCDYLFSQFIAYEMLQEYILNELMILEQKQASAGLATQGKKWFDWTGEIINLVELGYGIYLSKQLNDQKAGLAEIFRWLEESFGVQIGIPANRLREIRRRKRLSRTHFMELMQQVLIEYMDQDDAL